MRRADPLILMFVFVAHAALAANGKIEINQETVNAGGGFPYTLTTPGSDVLTGPLVVPASTDDGIVTSVDEVVLDLNGFSITGPFNCAPSNCGAGSGSAILPMTLFFGTRYATIRNGRIFGFAGTCVQVLSGTLIEDLTISDCGGVEISANARSVITRNRVFETGLECNPSRILARQQRGLSTVDPAALPFAQSEAVERVLSRLEETTR